MAREEGGFAATQRRYFERADAARFRWTTAAPGFADTEDALLAPLLPGLAEPCLEIGCGEGNNLVRLTRRARTIGVDRFAAKLAFAAAHVPAARLICADAVALPFRDGVFRSVFVRDLLHHVAEPERVLAEAVRLLGAGGRLFLLEPNGRNPIIRLQTLLVPAEAEARRSGTARIAAWLRALPLTAVEVRTLEPLPLRRMVLHYRFGLPSLGRVAAARRTLAVVEALARRLLPASRWSYVAVSAVRAA